MGIEVYHAMMNKEKVIKILKKELPYLRNEYYVKKVGLFGSFAKGKQQSRSDIDIVIEFKNPIGLKFVELAEYIENVLNRDVDILTPAGIEGIRIKDVAKNIKRGIIYV